MDTSTHTVKHFNSTTQRWHVEEGAKGEVWTCDQETAEHLAEGYKANGYKAVALPVSELAAVENLPFNGSLVEVEAALV